MRSKLRVRLGSMSLASVADLGNSVIGKFSPLPDQALRRYHMLCCSTLLASINIGTEDKVSALLLEGMVSCYAKSSSTGSKNPCSAFLSPSNAVARIWL